MKVIISIIVIISFYSIEISSQSLNWQHTNGPFGGYVRDLVYDINGNMFAGTSGGIFKSTDDGENWAISNGMIFHPIIYSMAASPNGTIFAGTFYDNILRSTDEGNSWTHVGFNVYYVVDAMAVKQDGTVFAGVEESDGSGGGSIYRSTNNGDTWTEVNSGLPDAALWQIRVDENGSLFIANIYGIYRSTNNGTSWTKLTNGITLTVASDVSINPLNNYIFASGYLSPGYAVFRSTDGGDSFTQLAFPTDINAHTLDVSPAGHLFIGASQSYPTFHTSIYRSTDDGDSFIEVDSSVSARRFAFGTSGNVFAGSYLGVHLSTDEGNSWELKVTGMNGVKVNTLAADNANNIYAGTSNGSYRSTDFGVTWELPGNITGLRTIMDIVTTSNGYIFAMSNSGNVLRSTDSGEIWTLLSISASSSSIYAASNDYLYLGTAYQGLFRSTDYGDTWTLQNSGLPATIFTLDFAGNSLGKIYAATNFNGIWQSSDNGDSWSSFNNYSGSIDRIVSNESGDVFWADNSNNDYELYRSTDNGSTYTQLTVIPGNPGEINDLFISPDQALYVAVTDENAGGVYRSTDNGDSFEMVSDGLTEKQLTSICMDSQEHLLAGTVSGVFRTMQAVPVELNSFSVSVSGSDVVLSWTTASETNNSGWEIERRMSEEKSENSAWEKIGFAGGFGTTTEKHSYQFNDKVLSTGKYSYRLKQLDFDGSFEYSSVVNVNIGEVREFKLSQNYPNPFNPVTIIYYQITNKNFVSLKVYDALGSEIATLVNEQKAPGRYSVEFDGSNLASGIYYYRITAGINTSVKKMILVK